MNLLLYLFYRSFFLSPLFSMSQEISIFGLVFSLLCWNHRFADLLPFIYIFLSWIVCIPKKHADWRKIIFLEFFIHLNYRYNSTHHYHRGLFFLPYTLSLYSFVCMCVLTFLAVSFKIYILFYFLYFLGITVVVYLGENSHTSYLNHTSYYYGKNLQIN